MILLKIVFAAKDLSFMAKSIGSRYLGGSVKRLSQSSTEPPQACGTWRQNNLFNLLYTLNAILFMTSSYSLKNYQWGINAGLSVFPPVLSYAQCTTLNATLGSINQLMTCNASFGNIHNLWTNKTLWSCSYTLSSLCSLFSYLTQLHKSKWNGYKSRSSWAQIWGNTNCRTGLGGEVLEAFVLVVLFQYLVL